MKKNVIIILISILLIVVALGGGYYLIQNVPLRPAPASSTIQLEPVESSDFVMDVLVTQKGYDENCKETFAGVIATFQELEGRLSRYVAGSEISQINDAAGLNSVSVSEETYNLLKQAVALCEESGGVFDITMGAVIDLWGFGTDTQRVPSDEEIASALEHTGYQKIVFDDENRTVKLPDPFMRIDLGGIVKGYATDLADAAYTEAGLSSVLLSTNSSILMKGPKPDGESFTIGVRDPRGSVNDYVGTLTIDNAFIGTSGDYERYFEMNGKRYHHIFDPATGKPAQNGLTGITVVHTNGMQADYLSTYLFIMGKDYVVEHLNDYEIIAVDDEKNVYVSDKLKDKFNFDQTSGYTLN